MNASFELLASTRTDFPWNPVQHAMSSKPSLPFVSAGTAESRRARAARSSSGEQRERERQSPPLKPSRPKEEEERARTGKERERERGGGQWPEGRKHATPMPCRKKERKEVGDKPARSHAPSTKYRTVGGPRGRGVSHTPSALRKKRGREREDPKSGGAALRRA